jgi:hypothetical protein
MKEPPRNASTSCFSAEQANCSGSKGLQYLARAAKHVRRGSNGLLVSNGSVDERAALGWLSMVVEGRENPACRTGRPSSRQFHFFIEMVFLLLCFLAASSAQGLGDRLTRSALIYRDLPLTASQAVGENLCSCLSS